MSVPSQTDRRQVQARKRLPELVEAILSGEKPLDERNLQLLYGEVRAIKRSNIPMRMRTGVQSGVDGVDLRTRGEIIEGLLEAESMTPTEIIEQFILLYAVTSDRVMVGV